MKLKWSRAALTDLQGILDFIRQDNPDAARALATGFRLTAEHLRLHPFLGKRGDLEGTRELVVHRNYLLSYRVGSEAVEILQIWHVAQKRFH
ncbi:MAG: type II toxin-antitoxin system RelE/ParE family toxin [Hydrogenophilales bacterium]|nr:type II toxin-antitoxin system RelE/ParE family toxin [Hydrogenophilales bacterium]